MTHNIWFFGCHDINENNGISQNVVPPKSDYQKCVTIYSFSLCLIGHPIVSHTTDRYVWGWGAVSHMAQTWLMSVGHRADTFPCLPEEDMSFLLSKVILSLPISSVICSLVDDFILQF